MGKYHPSFCIQGIHTAFLLDYSQHLIRAIQKINLEATSLNQHWDEGVTIPQLTSSKKLNTFLSHPIAGEKHIKSSRLSTHANAHATEVATTVFLKFIFKREPHINLARHVLDAIMTPDGSTILHA
jgi:hypothetical protein